jgi:DnaJ like chaperone protein
MGVWGKVVGGALGFLTGGPVGAVLGAAAGHAHDTGAVRMDPQVLLRLPDPEQAYGAAVIVLAAKLAKCDGPVRPEEIAAFRREFRIPDAAVAEVGRLFDAARANAAGWEPFADRLAEVCRTMPNRLEDTLSGLAAIARADAPTNRAEAAFLAALRQRVGLPALTDPYAVLGLARDSAPEQIRAAWRALVRDTHPDRLAAAGADRGAVAAATQRVAAINAAWNEIKRERGL